MILVPLSCDVTGAVAVVVTNVVFDSASMTVTTKGLRKSSSLDESTKSDDPLYLQRTMPAEALQVKVTVVPLHTSGPASLDRTTAAEAKGMKMASILYFYSIKQLGSTSSIKVFQKYLHITEATEVHSHWSGGGTVKTVLYVVNERACEARPLGGSGPPPPQEIFEFQAL